MPWYGPQPSLPSHCRRNRLGNVAQRTVYNGVTYDSKAEAEWARNLDIALRGGAIHCWLRQVTVPLVPKTSESKGVSVRVDFQVFTGPGRCYFDEVKGVETDKFKIVKELWCERGPCEMRVRTKKGKTWFCEVVPGKKGE